MARARVLSFMSTFGGPQKSSTLEKAQQQANPPPPNGASFGPSPTPLAFAPRDSPTPMAAGRQRASSRPMSMVGGYQPPLMEIASDTIPELAPVFTFLNNHSNKLYQEGYFLKLNDLDSHGRPYADRSWTECFAQLVGTVLSLWDAAALDAAGQDGEVAPTFINLADASIKMIETLPTRSQYTQPLANVLSVSTAGKNRYLFHFSNVNALTQWTAGIRLAMFENASLQEAYTGSLIAGKGKTLNNIRTIMAPTKFKTEEWTRVRFGAGTPWRRCWCVIAPPDEKEVAAYKKQTKKKSAYDRSFLSLKGSIKFYDTSKTKKVQPIATINDAYSAYSIYPQSKPLIDQSTLIKIEGTITIHTKPETTTEGFIFVMSEVRPAISGFEMMLRFLFPIYDIFALYGRPARLAADRLDTRSLMFAMPQNRRVEYLEIFDVVTLIHTTGSQSWSEREWKKQMKQLSSQRMNRMSISQEPSRAGSRHGHRNSLPSRSALRFQDNVSNRSTPSLPRENDEFVPKPLPHSGSAPPGDGPYSLPAGARHHRSASETVSPAESPRRRGEVGPYGPSRLSHEAPRSSSEEEAPPPPVHGMSMNEQGLQHDQYQLHDRSSSESERRYMDAPEQGLYHAEKVHPELSPSLPPGPVVAPPAFSHQPGAKPQTRPNHSPELRRANSRMSSTTLSQLAAANSASSAGVSGNTAAAGAAAAWERSHSGERKSSEDRGQRVNDYNNTSGSGMAADGLIDKGMVLDLHTNLPVATPQPLAYQHEASQPYPSFNGPQPPPYHLHAPAGGDRRSVSPLPPTTPVYNITETKPRPGSYPPPITMLEHASTLTNIETKKTSSNEPPKTPNLPELQNSPHLLGLNMRHSIARKPVGGLHKRPDAPERVQSSEKSSLYRMDEVAFNRVSTMQSATSTEVENRRYSVDSSHYEDSVLSPDYASTIESSSTRRGAQPTLRSPGVRTGVLKTVGGNDDTNAEVKIGDMQYRHSSGHEQGSNNWNIDFGPTHIYKPEVLSSQLPNSNERQVMQRDENQNALSSATKHTTSPSYLVDSHTRSSSRAKFKTLEFSNSRPSSVEPSDNRRNIAWHPGGAVLGTTSNRVSITPEEFVQQRAAENRALPSHAHTRHHSGPQTQGNRQTSHTPPLTSRHVSGDRPAATNQSSSPARPHSRAASSAMNISQNLSAREQEHISRVTGSPLINLAGNSNRPPSQGGLVAAIEEREREKRELKSGTSKLVQQAISQRQQHHHHQNPYPSPTMYMPGQYPPSPSYETQRTGQHSWSQGTDSNMNAIGTLQQPHSQYYQQIHHNQFNQQYSNRGSYFNGNQG